MRKYLFFILLFVFLFLSKGNAQQTHENQMSIGYYGNYLVNPGINVSIYKPLAVNDKFLGSIFNRGLGQASLHAKADMGLYWDPFSHTGLHLNWGVNYRQFLGRFIGFQIGAGPGIQSNFVSDVFKLNRQGELVNRLLHADLYFAPKISFGTFISNRSKTHQLIGTFHITFLWKYNSSVLPALAYELSYTF